MRSLGIALAVVVAAAVARAEDDVDLQVRGNEKIDGTIRPAEQGERFLIDAPMGAILTATLKKKGTGGPVPSFDVLDGTGAVVVHGITTPTGAKLSRYTLGKSDLYRVRVTGDQVLDGDYQIKLKVQTVGGWFGGGLAPLAPGATVDYTFAAPSGSTADFIFFAYRSSMNPRLVSVDGPGGFHHDFTDEGVTLSRHRFELPLAGTGDYTVKLRNIGPVEGTWGIQVGLDSPRIGKTNVDIRDTALTGSFGGSNSVFGRVVDPGGALVDPPETGGPLDGSSVSVPSDALSTPTVIALQSSDTFFVDDTNHAAGIAVSLVPSGTVFATPVVVTVPYDPQSFDDPANELSIYIQNAETGELEAVPRNLLIIDQVNQRVSFPASHFSRFQGTSPKPRPVKGEFLQIEVGGRAVPTFGGQVVFGFTRFQAFKGNRSGNGFQRKFGRRSIAFGPANLALVRNVADDFGILTIDDDQLVTMQSGTDGALKFVRGRNPDVLIQPPGGGDLAASASVVLRVANGKATPRNLAGLWTATVLEFTGAKNALGTVSLSATGQNALLEFGLDGRVVAVRSSRTTSGASDDAGTWTTLVSKVPPPPGMLTFDEAGPTLSMALGSSVLITEVALTPCLSGDLLVGVADAVSGDPKAPAQAAMRLVTLVRTSKTGGPALLTGDALFSRFGIVPVDRPGASQDVRFFGDDAIVNHDGVRTVSGLGSRFSLGHDPAGAVLRGTNDFTIMGSYFVGKDGSYREIPLSAAGVVSARGGLYGVTRFAENEISLGFGVVGKPKQ